MQFYIISAERFNKSVEDNNDRTFGLVKEMLRLGLSFTAVKGVYKGTAEQSFIVFAHGMPDGWIMATMRGLYQESILAVGDGGDASLVYADGDTEYLGKFQSHDGALDALEAYTLIAGQAWVCK